MSVGDGVCVAVGDGALVGGSVFVAVLVGIAVLVGSGELVAVAVLLGCGVCVAGTRVAVGDRGVAVSLIAVGDGGTAVTVGGTDVGVELAHAARATMTATQSSLFTSPPPVDTPRRIAYTTRTPVLLEPCKDNLQCPRAVGVRCGDDDDARTAVVCGPRGHYAATVR